jgi:hypothetical protein
MQARSTASKADLVSQCTCPRNAPVAANRQKSGAGTNEYFSSFFATAEGFSSSWTDGAPVCRSQLRSFARGERELEKYAFIYILACSFLKIGG